MCPECDGLGRCYTLRSRPAGPRPDAVVRGRVRSSWSARGATWAAGGGTSIEGVADTLEHRPEDALAATLLETPGTSCDQLQYAALGHRRRAHHLHLAERGGGVWKHGGKCEGIVPELLAQYQARPQAGRDAAARKVHARASRCPDCHGAAAQPAGPRGARHAATCRSSRDRPIGTLPEVCRLAVADAGEFFNELELDRHAAS